MSAYQQLKDLIQNAFRCMRIEHKLQQEALSKILTASTTESVAIICLTGPTGGGKTDLLEQFKEATYRRLAAEMAEDLSFIPIGACTAQAGGKKEFLYSALYVDTLRSLKDPFYAKRERAKTRHVNGNVHKSKQYGESIHDTSLRLQLKDCFSAHRSIYWMIDEAYHLIRSSKNGNTPGDQYGILKSHGQQMKVQMLIAGTYNLPTSINYEGELSRRTERIQLPCYHWHIPEEKLEFLITIESMMASLQAWVKYPSAAKNAEFFYAGTAGCVGIFHDWLDRALSVMFEGSEKSLKIEHFQNTKLGKQPLIRIRHEIARGEAEHRSQEWDDDFYLEMLADPHSVFSTQDGDNSDRTARSTAKAKPGTRKPVRDFTG